MDKLNESWSLADGGRLCYRHCFRNLILIALVYQLLVYQVLHRRHCSTKKTINDSRRPIPRIRKAPAKSIVFSRCNSFDFFIIVVD